jgi:hypothetical protein
MVQSPSSTRRVFTGMNMPFLALPFLIDHVLLVAKIPGWLIYRSPDF